MGLATFLIVVQSLITLVHWIVFQSMDFYFGWSGAAEYYIFWTFSFSSFTFLLSNIATRVAPGHLARLAYRIAAWWLGTVYFLFLATVGIAFLEMLSAFLVQTMPFWVAKLFYVVAVGLSFYSYRAAERIHIVRHDIALPYLPHAWCGKKVVFFADTHYGNIHRERRARQLVKLIEAEEPALVLMGGDFFDGPPIEADQVTAPYWPLTKRVPTLFVSGNHEEYGKKADFLRSLQENGFRIINDQLVVLDGLQIVGLDFMTTRTAAATAMTMKHLELDPHLPTIVLKHIPRHVEAIEEAGGHLLLSGHTHQGQMWPIQFITRFVYHGFDYGLNLCGNLHVYTTSGAGSWGPPQRFFTQTEIAVFTLEKK